MKRGYQDNYSLINPDSVHNKEVRLKKANTILRVLQDYFSQELSNLKLLDIGAATGIIDHHLAHHLNYVKGIDIDQHAIEHAKENYQKDNLSFETGDAMQVDEEDASFDIIICSHVYEHVPDQQQLIREIYRVLKPNGICYFSAGNRLNIMEPHYQLPFLSILPHFLAHLYLRILGRGSHYYERHLTCPSLRKLVQVFTCHDYTRKMVANPKDFDMEYMLPEGSRKAAFARFISTYMYWLMPGYIWLLEKKP